MAVCSSRMKAMTPRTNLKYHLIFLGIASLFCLSCLLMSALTARPGFEVGVQSTPAGDGLVIRRTTGYDDAVQIGDIIEGINGHSVHTRAAFYHHLLNAGDSAEITVRRLNGKFQRPVSASDFAHGALPLGVRADDKPILIADADGNYSPLDNVDFETLRSMVSERQGSVSVVFKRPEEIVDVAIHLRSASGRTFSASLILLVIGLMGLVAWQGRRRFANADMLWTNAILAMGAMGVMTLGLWTTLMSIPPLFMLGLIGLTLFKVTDLDYHNACSGGIRSRETWVRIAIYAGPIATLIVPLWTCLTEIPVLWGQDTSASAEMRLDAFVMLPMLWAAAYTLIDATLMLIRRHKASNRALQSSEIGVYIAAFLSLFVFVFVRTDLNTAQWFLMVAILVQCVSNALPCFMERCDAQPIRLNGASFSMAPIVDAFDAARRLLGDEWLIQVAIDRPSPYHLVAMTRADEDDEDALEGINLNILPDAWRDFLEIFRIEGEPITGEKAETPDAIQGMAEKLGIVIALPIGDNVAGTLTSLTFLVSSRDRAQETPRLHLSDKQRAELSELLDVFMNCAAAMVYQSAEMSLEYIGEDIDALTRQYHETASFARALKNPTTPLDPTALPHGLLDEDEPDEMALPQEGAAGATPGAESASDDETSSESTKELEENLFSESTKEFEEVQFLRSQVAALYSQQIRGYELSEIEMTRAQKNALEEVRDIDPPLLLIGEPGTGKRLIALSDHQMRSGDVFLSIDAATLPESIFALDMFGDGDDPGLIANAAGGGILILNAERVPETLMDDIKEAIEKLSAKNSIALYLSVNVKPDAFSVEQYRLDPSVLPENLQSLAARTDAEIVVLEPLRLQDDLDIAAEFICGKQALTSGRPVEGFTPEAMLALKSYAWSGNFTELRMVVERAVLRCEGKYITVADLGKDFVDLADASTKNLALSGTDVYREQLQLMQVLNETQQNQIERLNERIEQLEMQLHAAKPGSGLGSSMAQMLDGSYADIEKRLLDKLLEKYQYDPDKAADALGVNRARFFNKLSKYHLLRGS